MQRRSAEPFLFDNPKKNVSFAVVEVREYPIILGDSPACSTGAPISIGWNASASASYTIDEWEGERFIARRPKADLRVPASRRVELLLGAGYSAGQIYRASQGTQEERHGFQASSDRSNLARKADMVAERMKLKLERAIGERGRGLKPMRWTLSPNGFLIPSK